MLHGWSGTIRELLEGMECDHFIEYLTSFLNREGFEVSESHRRSWKDCYRFLSKVFQNHMDLGQMGSLQIAFEYMLPFEGGRRTDVILFLEGRVLILEFKEKNVVLPEDIEQAIGYRESLLNFHHQTQQQKLKVEAYLVLTKLERNLEPVRGVRILNASNFVETLQIAEAMPMSPEAVQAWLDSEYQPLPGVIDATLQLFSEGELPFIKSIAEGEIQKTLHFVKKCIYHNEMSDHKKRILFVSGVPGAGKTLVALQTLYSYNEYKYREYRTPISAIYLSGNGPLVNVLQTQLQSVNFNGSKGNAFVRGVFSFKQEYLRRGTPPPFTTILFDEAQRAWDIEAMKNGISEPEGLLQVGERIYQQYNHVTIVCFIGDGQFIHSGEEGGNELWVEALKKHPDWEVLVPDTYAAEFNSVGAITDNSLFLNTSIRHNFIDTSEWLRAVLAADIQKATAELATLHKKGFLIRVSQNFEACKTFVEQQSQQDKVSRYGILVSSKADQRHVASYIGVPQFTSYINDKNAGKWFLQDCREWQVGASEFACIGLELDYPVVCFGGEYFLKARQWQINDELQRRFQRTPGGPKLAKQFDNFPAIMENIYRVLLSRSQKGIVLYIPDIPHMKETFDFFAAIGVDILE